MKTLGVAAGFAAAASGFMIPSTMSLSDEAAARLQRLDGSSIVRADTSSHFVKLDCPECEGPSMKQEFQDVALVLEFATSDDQTALMLNGRRLFPNYPFEPLVASEAPAIVPTSLLIDRFEELTTPPRPLFFGSSTRTIPAADGSDAELIDLDFQINGVGDIDVTVDALSIRLLRDEDGLISIASIVRVPTDGVADAVDEDDMEEEMEFAILPIDPIIPAVDSTPAVAECNGPTILCRMKELVEGRIAMMREAIEKSHQGHGFRKGGCHGMMRGGHGRPPFPLKGGPNKFWGMRPDGFGPHGGRHHHRHHHASYMHRFFHIMHRVFFGFLLPVLIGVAAGMTASLVGMMVGTTIAWVWIRLVRGGRRGSANRAPTVTIIDSNATPEEKQLLMDIMEDEEALPVYVEKE